MRGCVFIKFKTTVSHTLQCTVSSFERSSETRWRNIKLLLMHVSQRVACWLQKRDCVRWSKQIYWAGLELVTQLRGELVPPWYILIESCEKKRTVVYLIAYSACLFFHIFSIEHYCKQIFYWYRACNNCDKYQKWFVAEPSVCLNLWCRGRDCMCRVRSYITGTSFLLPLSSIFFPSDYFFSSFHASAFMLPLLHNKWTNESVTCSLMEL